MGYHLDLLTGKMVHDKPKRKSPEAGVGKAIDQYLRALGYYMRTIKSDGTKAPDGWRRSAQGAGIADRIGISPAGRFIAVELKAPGRKSTLTEAQRDFLVNIAMRGGVACVADCIADVERALTQSKEELLLALGHNSP